MKKLVVVDYGMGNLHSVMKGIEKVKVPVKLSSKAKDIKESAGIIIPGVGAFEGAMKEIRKRKLLKVIKEEVKKGKPVLGVCLGMQLLLSCSTEFGRHNGFGFIKGKVVRFKKGMKVPHMGWNKAAINKKSEIMKGMKNNDFYYFVHSYYAVPSDKKAVLTKTQYNNTIFSSGVEYKNVYGFQFHPEKSGEKSLKIYRNFYKICCRDRS